MKKYILLSLLPVILLSSCQNKTPTFQLSDNVFGIFLGLKNNKASKLFDYQNVAIELDEFNENNIHELRSRDINIYAYLSIGSLEKYRDYYDDFKDITFMDYENWPDERWVDVSNSSWQNHIISEASRLKNLGAKGIFMDNFDVYYIASEEYECSNDFKEGIYQGCKTILEQLHALELSLLINSGSMFFRRLIEEESPDINYIDWYAQECVFSTIIDYDHDVFARQEQEEKEYNLENIALMKDKSNILLIEYTKNEKLAKEIKKFSELNNFNYFISKKVNLE